MRRFPIPIALMLVVAVLAGPAAAEVTPADLEDAKAELRRVGSDLSGAAAEYEEAFHSEEELQSELDALLLTIANQERQLASAREDGRAVVIELYKAGGAAAFAEFLTAESFEDIPAQLAYLDVVTQSEQSVLNHLASVERSYRQQQDQLDAAVAEQGRVRSELESLQQSIVAELDRANAEYQVIYAEWEAQEEARRRREAEAARIAAAEAAAAAAAAKAAAEAAAAAVAATSTTTVPSAEEDTTTTTTTTGDDTTTTTTVPPATSSGRTCPVNGATTFTDSYGAPRPGGRSHKGVDMMASRGTPVVAIEAGTLTRKSSSSAGGISLYMKGDSGDTYYYAHLDGYASGVTGGMALTVGQLIGYVGSTGNASYSAPHLHFEHQNGNVNPYPLVKGLCG